VGFIIEGELNFVVDLNSYSNKIPSSEYIQAVTGCKLIVFTEQALAKLSHTILGWDEMLYKITARALLEKVRQIRPMLAEEFARLFEQCAWDHKNRPGAITHFFGDTTSNLRAI
jgi:hypothetical protein